MKSLKKVFVLVILLCCFPLRIDAAEYTIDDYRNAVVETTKTYVRQGVQLQYDTFRKNLYATPEDATSRHIVYSVCSGLTFQSYYQALGVRLPEDTGELLSYAYDVLTRNEYSSFKSEYVLAYYKTSPTAEEINDYGFKDLDTVLGGYSENNPTYLYFFKDLYQILEPGDLIVYNGHVAMVTNVDRSDSAKKIVAGISNSTHRNDLKTIVTLSEPTSAPRYDIYNRKDVYETESIFYDDSSLSLLLHKRWWNGLDISKLAVIRPIIGDDNGNFKYLYQSDAGTDSNYDYKYEEKSFSMKPAAISRLKFPNIDIEKIVDIENSPNQQGLVNVGETMKYTLTVKNNSENDYDSFNIVEYIDSNVDVIDKGNGTLTNNELKWNNIVLKAGESRTFVYIVRVPLEKDLFGKILVSTGKVDNIATSKIETYVGNKFNKAEKDKILKIDINSVDGYERDFINNIYIKAFDLDLGLSNVYGNLDIIGYKKLVDSDGKELIGGKTDMLIRKTEIKDELVANYIYKNYYGLRILEKDCAEKNIIYGKTQWNHKPTYELTDRSRDITQYTIEDGDIILLYTSDATTESNNSCPEETLENRSYIYLDGELIRKLSDGSFEKISGDALTTFLRDIVGDNYIILKPSLTFGEGIDQFNPVYNVNITWDDLTFDWVYDEKLKEFNWKANSTCEEYFVASVDDDTNNKEMFYSDDKCSSVVDVVIDGNSYYKEQERNSARITIEDASVRGQIVPSIKWNSNDKYAETIGVFKYIGNKCIAIESEAVYDVALNYGIYSNSTCTVVAVDNGFEKGKYYALVVDDIELKEGEISDVLRHSGDYGEEIVDGIRFGGYSKEGTTNLYDLSFNLKNIGSTSLYPNAGDEIGNITITFKSK